MSLQLPFHSPLQRRSGPPMNNFMHDPGGAPRQRWIVSCAMFIAILMLSIVQVSPMRAQTSKSQPANAATPRPGKGAGAGSDAVARGKYIVEGVAMCGECHTPRDSEGNPDRRRWLQGAPMVWQSPTHDPNWPLSAPRIGGTPPADDADMVKLLMTGIWTTGARLRQPMPQFRMNPADAEAVVAYLKSLNTMMQ